MLKEDRSNFISERVSSGNYDLTKMSCPSNSIAHVL